MFTVYYGYVRFDCSYVIYALITCNLNYNGVMVLLLVEYSVTTSPSVIH